MQQQQNKVLKFHLSCKIFIVLEGEIHCNTELLLKAKWEKEILLYLAKQVETQAFL